MRGIEVKLADLNLYDCMNAALKTLATIEIPSYKEENLAQKEELNPDQSL